MDIEIYLYDEDKEDFKKIEKHTSNDCIYVVCHEEKTVYIWQGAQASRMQKYKAGTKVTSLISEKQFYGYRHQVIEESDEPDSIKPFIEDHFGRRDLTPQEIAEEDRNLVKQKVQAISERFQSSDSANPVSPSSSPTAATGKDPVYNDFKQKIALAKKKGASSDKSSKETTVEPLVKQDSTQEKESEEGTTPEEENQDYSALGKKTKEVETDEIKQVVKSMTGNLGSGMSSGMPKKNQDQSEVEKKIKDEFKREQERADNEISVEAVKIIDQDKQGELRKEEDERIHALEKKKIKREMDEEERIAYEKKFLEEKLKHEKELMEAERKQLEEKLRQEDIARKKHLKNLETEREAKKKEIVEFEMRKIDLRMKLRQDGVDYIQPPPEGGNLYRIEEGKPLPMEENYLTMADVYMLDKGNEIYTWNGMNAALDEKFFGEEIPKLLKKARGGDVSLHNVDQFQEPPAFVTSFKSLKIIDADYTSSILKLNDVKNEKGCLLFKVKTESGLLFQEVTMDHDSISNDDSYLFDFGRQIFIWHGRDANPDERNQSEKIAKAFAAERQGGVSITIIEEGKEPEYGKLPAEVWLVLKGEEEAAKLKLAHEKAVSKLEQIRLERERNEREVQERKKEEDDKKALVEMERIEREMLEKEIERKKDKLTPAEIEEKWRSFRKKMRKRRGLPEEEDVTFEEVMAEMRDEKPEPEEPEIVKTPEEIAAEKEKRKREIKMEFEQLKRIEEEMLAKKIDRENPTPEKEQQLRDDLAAKLDKKWTKMQADLVES